MGPKNSEELDKSKPNQPPPKCLQNPINPSQKPNPWTFYINNWETKNIKGLIEIPKAVKTQCSESNREGTNKEDMKIEEEKNNQPQKEPMDPDSNPSRQKTIMIMQA